MAKRNNHFALPEYNLDIVGDDVAQAKRILRQLRKGISRAADICKISPPVCVENLGIPRDQMPQIEGGANVLEMLDGESNAERAKARAILAAGAKKTNTRTVLEQFLDRLEKAGVKTKRNRVPVGTLKATQAQIQAAKVFAMADAHLRGLYPNIDKQVVISKDHYILDGHHRWAALTSIDPKRYMSVLKVDLPMKALLHEAAAQPGVYRATFEGEPLPDEDQKAYKRAHRSRVGKKRAGPRERAPTAAEVRRITHRAIAEAMR